MSPIMDKRYNNYVYINNKKLKCVLSKLSFTEVIVAQTEIYIYCLFIWSTSSDTVYTYYKKYHYPLMTLNDSNLFPP